MLEEGTIIIIMMLAAVHQRQILFSKSKYLFPKMFTRRATAMTAQNIN